MVTPIQNNASDEQQQYRIVWVEEGYGIEDTVTKRVLFVHPDLKQCQERRRYLTLKAGKRIAW